MSATNTKAETWSKPNGLRQAIDEMNALPDISGDDSPRLRELCRVTALEIKAVGGVGAATSLEMIGYIRELEDAKRSRADHYVAWCRYTYNEEGGIQSVKTCDSDAKGAFKVYAASPLDTAALVALRDAAKAALPYVREVRGYTPSKQRQKNADKVVQQIKDAIGKDDK